MVETWCGVSHMDNPIHASQLHRFELIGQNQVETDQNQAKIGIKFAKWLKNFGIFYVI